MNIIKVLIAGGLGGLFYLLIFAAGIYQGLEQGIIEGQIQNSVEIYEGLTSYCLYKIPATLQYFDVDNKSININILSYNICLEANNFTCIECPYGEAT